MQARSHTRHRVYKTFFPSSAELRLKMFLFINIKMPTRIDIETFISRIKFRLWCSKPEIAIYLGYFVIYEQFKKVIVLLVTIR